jgi:manganese transport protein
MHVNNMNLPRYKKRGSDETVDNALEVLEGQSKKGRLTRLSRYELVDVVVAMGLASLINAAMRIMAASTFFQQGLTEVGTLEQAHRTLETLLGRASSWIFAVSLLASGLSSSAVGTMAGQVIMQGFLQMHIPIWVRRLVTIIPSLIVIGIGHDPTRTLVISQVVLCFGLPFAVIPLVILTIHSENAAGRDTCFVGDCGTGDRGISA